MKVDYVTLLCDEVKMFILHSQRELVRQLKSGRDSARELINVELQKLHSKSKLGVPGVNRYSY